MKKAKAYWLSINLQLDKAFQNSVLLWILFFAVLAGNLYYKFFFLQEMHLKNDDAFSVFYAQQSLSELYTQLAKEANPPLYFTFLHFWIKLFGIGPIAVKSLSALFSVGAALTIFAICKKHMDLLGAFTASSLFLFSNVHFDFSHEVRAFSLVVFLCALSIYLFLNAIKEPKVKWLILLCIVNASLPYAHYTAVLLPLTEFLIAFSILISNRHSFFRITLSFIGSAVLFIPQLLNFSDTIPDDNFWLKKPSKSDLDYVFARITGHDPSHDLIINLLLIALVLSTIHFLYSIFTKEFDYKKQLLFIAVFFVPILLNYAIAQYTPVFRMRYMLFAGLGVILGLSYLFTHIKLPALLKMCLVVYLLVPFYKGFRPENRNYFRWDKAAKAVDQNYSANHVFLIHPAWRLNDFTYYFDRQSFRDYRNMHAIMEQKGFKTIYQANQIDLEENSSFTLLRRNLPNSEFAQNLIDRMKEMNYSLEESYYSDDEILIETWRSD
ncbi:MAG: glycosyltransferase family 39 protein [Bacteroidota bacterium]